MQVIADLQLHSKYSRAVSPQMVIPEIARWAKLKGIKLIATGDWTHPLWMREIKSNLEENGNGLFKIKSQISNIKDEINNPLFLLATEVSCIYSQGGKLRRIHTLLWVPTIVSAEAINKELLARGAHLMSDGRPIVGLTSTQIADIVLSIEPKALIIPAHAWTPWFSLFGSESGFDSIAECFGTFEKNIYAIETGLSSDPAMNWRIKELDDRSIVSFSDAHSGPKLGREATVFDLQELSYDAIREAIIGKNHESRIMNQGATENRIAYTLEFYPEEGKYHYTGHRNCLVKQTPQETKEKGNMCPVCGKKLTVGVMHRVEQLAGRQESSLNLIRKGLAGTLVEAVYSKTFSDRPPFTKLVPLQEIIAESENTSVTSQNVKNEYFKCIDLLGSEFSILLHTSTAEISRVAGERIAEAVEKVRKGDIVIDPGYDGVFGIVKIWKDNDADQKAQEQKDQLSLF